MLAFLRPRYISVFLIETFSTQNMTIDVKRRYLCHKFKLSNGSNFFWSIEDVRCVKDCLTIHWLAHQNKAPTCSNGHPCIGLLSGFQLEQVVVLICWKKPVHHETNRVPIPPHAIDALKLQKVNLHIIPKIALFIDACFYCIPTYFFAMDELMHNVQ